MYFGNPVTFVRIGRGYLPRWRFCDTNCPLHGAHAIGARERGAALDEFIEVRRLDVLVAERGDGVGTLVVREKEHDLGPFLLLGDTERGRAQQKQNCQRDESIHGDSYLTRQAATRAASSSER